MLVSVDDPIVGPRMIVGNPIKMDDLEDSVQPPPPTSVGQHTREVLRELLGLGDAEIDALVASGAVCV
jgi:crotonobetainyl-CoA:carnitine CoA-transferase CaiB-like acyl-CoA transferase